MGWSWERALVARANAYEEAGTRGQPWTTTAKAHLETDCQEVLLDVGCGTGNSLLPLADRARMVIGLDKTHALLNVARERSLKEGVENTYFVVGDAEALPLKTDCADAVICRYVLHHTRLKVSLAEIRRVSVPGGRVFAIDKVNGKAWERSPVRYALHSMFQIARKSARGRFGAARKSMKLWLSPSWARHMLVDNKKLTGEAFAAVCEEVLPGNRIEDLGNDVRSLRWTASRR